MANLAFFKGERSAGELAARLFQVNGGDPQVSSQVIEALIRANPQLANLDRVPSGSVIVVPDMPYAVNAGEIVQPATAAVADPARSVGEHMAAFASGLAAASGSAAAQANSTLELLKDRSLKAAAANDPVLAQRLTSIEENTKTTLKDVDAKQTMLQQAIAQMQQDLAKFLKPPVPSPQAGPGRDQPPVAPPATPEVAPVPRRRPPRTARASRTGGGRKTK
jgi:hypothetical protein